MERRYYEGWTPAKREHDTAVIAAAWLVVGSLILWPLALAAFVVGATLMGRRPKAGAWTMALAVVAAVLGLATSTATASPYPGDAAAPPMVQKLARWADEFWHARGVPSCAAADPRVADSLVSHEDGIDAAGRADIGQCGVYVLRSLVTMADDPVMRGGELHLCAVVFHEAGHTGGLRHVEHGLMAGDGYLAIPWKCRAWARRRLEDPGTAMILRDWTLRQVARRIRQSRREVTRASGPLGLVRQDATRGD